jgi:hypothetical protein
MKKKLSDFSEIAAEWNQTKNDQNLFDLSAWSRYEAWWIGKCGHEFKMRVDLRCDPNRKSGCPYCKRHKVKDVLPITHPHLVEEWHPGNKFKPDNVTAGCVTKVLWLGKCGHEWEATVRNRAKKRPSGCPYCAGRLVSQETSLLTKFPLVAAEWHPTKNDTTPDKVYHGTWKKYWWIGSCGHEWKTSVHARTRKQATNCPWCYRSKGEERISQILTSLGLDHKEQVRFDSCRDKRPLAFDFQVGNVLIEYQGQQHFEPTRFSDCDRIFADVQRRDQIKREWCRQNGFNLVEIPYTKYDCLYEIITKEVCYSPTHPRRLA